jgi:hypothetical protein
MTAEYPRIRAISRRACAAGLIALVALVGCKSSDGGKGRDPLVHGPNRIPPQNVPLNDRAGTATKGTKGDPLLERPVGKTGDKSGIGYSDDPSRFKGTHIPGPGTTPAALAGKSRDDELKIDAPDNRVPLQPTGGIISIESNGGTALDGLFRELERYGVKREDATLARENGRYVFRASITSPGGAKRAFSGIGDTTNDAVKQVLDQIALDRK